MYTLIFPLTVIPAKTLTLAESLLTYPFAQSLVGLRWIHICLKLAFVYENAIFSYFI